MCWNQLKANHLQMPLTEVQIKEILEKPKKKATIQRALSHEDHIRFHSEVALEKSRVSAYDRDFRTWVKGLIPPDKYRTFESLYRYPVRTVQETGKAYDALSKVHDGQNPVYKYEFTKPTFSEDWEKYRADHLNAQERWRIDGFETMKLAINSVIICDMPAEQKTQLPEPYFYFLNLCHAMDYQVDKDQKFEWFIFRQSHEQIVVIDDESYRVFDYPEKDLQILKRKTLAIHELGYCPVSWFWKDVISKMDPEIKLSPISKQLPALDWMLFEIISKNHLETYASYPIYSVYQEDCDYEHTSGSQETNNYVHETCDGGFLRDQDNQYIMLPDGAPSFCPICYRKRLAGPGSLIQVPRPSEANDFTDMRNPVGITGIDKDSLTHKVEEIDRLKRQFYEDVTGYGGEMSTDQAKNEKQIIAAFESRTLILRDHKKNWEAAISWTDATICRLRYGKGFVTCTVNLGTDFYLYDANDILEVYQAMIEADADGSILDRLQDQYLATVYRNNPEQLTRERILANVDPLRHISKDKAIDLFSRGLISPEDYIIKLKFSTFVQRIEREEGSLLEFGKDLEWNTRIQKIIKIFNQYGKESKIERPEPGQPEPGGKRKPQPGGAN